MKALVGAFNQEKALVGAFSVIVQPVVEPMDRFTALVLTAERAQLRPTVPEMTHLWEVKAAIMRKVLVASLCTPRLIPAQ